MSLIGAFILPDVFLDLVRMNSTEHNHLLNSRRAEKLQSVVQDRHVHKWHKSL